jgi:aspartate carbamoyltransferase regulatory subunit
MIQELTNFYRERENKLQELTGLKDSEFKKKIGTIIKQVDQNYYNKQITGIQDIDNFFEALKGNEEARAKFMKNKKALSNGTVAWMLSLFKDKEFKKHIGTDKEQLKASVERYKEKVEITLTFIQDYISNIMGPNTPDATINAIMELVVTEKMPKDIAALKGRNKTTIKNIKEITEDELRMINSLTQFQSPKTEKGKTRQTVYSRKNSASYANAMAAQFGSTLSEVSASRLLAGVVQAAGFNTVGELQRELTGKKDKEIDISDFVLKANFSEEGKPFQIGVDVKYNVNPAKAGKVYTRGSSQKSRFFAELEHLFIARELKAVTYLLTNLYFHKGSSDQEYNDYFDQIMQLIIFTGGLRTLLPTNQGDAIDFKNPKNVQTMVQSDKRIFVMLNQKLFLMTTFLESIDNSLFQSEVRGSNSARKVLMNNFSSILDSINSGNNIGELTVGMPTGPFYTEKLKVLKTTGGSEVYKTLKSQVSDPVLSMAMLGWRYDGLNIPLVIKGA